MSVAWLSEEVGLVMGALLLKRKNHQRERCLGSVLATIGSAGMTFDKEAEYYILRERQERGLADAATDHSARAAHLALADEYRKRALAASCGGETARMTLDELLRADPSGRPSDAKAKPKP
jgi:hypothetical protein